LPTEKRLQCRTRAERFDYSKASHSLKLSEQANDGCSCGRQKVPHARIGNGPFAATPDSTTPKGDRLRSIVLPPKCRDVPAKTRAAVPVATSDQCSC